MPRRKLLATDQIGEPISDDEVRELGFEPTPNGWKPRVEPRSRRTVPVAVEPRAAETVPDEPTTKPSPRARRPANPERPHR